MNTEALEYRLSQLQAQIDRLERVNAALKQNIAEQQQDFQRMSRELVDLRTPKEPASLGSWRTFEQPVAPVITPGWPMRTTGSIP